jgi:hypothetical protein
MSDPKVDPSEEAASGPDRGNELSKTKTDATGLADATADQILTAIRGNESLAGVVDGRDVSLVYIDRHQVHNYFQPEAVRSETRRPADATAAPRRQRRIGELVVSPVPGWELERTAAVYVDSPPFEAATRRLRQHGVLFLHGPRGTGKRATALRMLRGILFDETNDAIYELNPNLHLTDLRPDDLPAQTALLLESADSSALDGLNRFQLDALCSALDPTGRNNALVVVTERLPVGFPHDYQHLTLEWRLPWAGPSLMTQHEALIRHVRYLTYHAPDYFDVIEPQLRRLDTFQPISQLMREALSPGQIADLAGLLAPALRGEISVEQAVAGLEQRASSDVERWFSQGHPYQVENFLIAAAVFSGAPYGDVQEAARVLETYLQPTADKPPNDEKPARPVSRFAGRESRRAQLEAIQARAATTSRRTHYGEILEDAIELNNPAWQEAVLRFMWDDPAYSSRVLAWLKAYGAHSNHHLRTRAAAAIGALARQSFSAIEADPLRAWAASPDANTRRSAAQVLGITIWDETFSAPTARLLHYWASQTDQPRWQWTAAAAYAGLAGPRYPEQSLEDLKLIARNSLQNPGLLEPYFRALLAFYATAQDLPERRLALLEELEGWSAEQPLEKRDGNHTVALRSAAVLAFWAMLWPERTDPVWQLLLTDIGVPGTPQALAVQIMRRSFSFRLPHHLATDGPHPRQLALEGLRNLIRYVAREHNEEHRAYLDGLLTALMTACRTTDPDEVERLRYHAEQWQESSAEAHDTLQILLAG